MFYYLWGVFRVRRKHPNLQPHVPRRKCSNFNGDLLAADQRTHAHASYGPSFSKEQYASVDSDPTFIKSATCEDDPSLIPLEANHEGAPNGENSPEPFCGGPLEDQHHKSIIASFSRNNNSAINKIYTAPTRKEQVSAYFFSYLLKLLVE